MKFLKKINKGLLLTIILLVVLVIYFKSVERQREANKPEIKKACEEFIAFTDKYVVLPEDMQTFTGKISKEDEEKLKKQLKEELEKYMIKDDKSIEMQSKYLFDELNKSYNTENQLKTGNKRIMTKILGYQFEGNQVTVQFNSSVEMNYKYIEDDIEKEKKDILSGTKDEITLQKYNGQWKVVYSNMQFDNNDNMYYDDQLITY